MSPLRRSRPGRSRNSLVPNVLSEPAPLTPEERVIAEQLYFHAIRAAAACQGEAISDRSARAVAKKMIRGGERGLTTMGRLSQGLGCLVVLGGMLGVGAGLAVLSIVAMMAAG